MEINREVATKDFMDGYAQGFKDGRECTKKYFEGDSSENLDDNIHKMSMEESVKISRLVSILLLISNEVNYIPSSAKTDLLDIFKFFSEGANDE